MSGRPCVQANLAHKTTALNSDPNSTPRPQMPDTLNTSFPNPSLLAQYIQNTRRTYLDADNSRARSRPTDLLPEPLHHGVGETLASPKVTKSLAAAAEQSTFPLDVSRSWCVHGLSLVDGADTYALARIWHCSQSLNAGWALTSGVQGVRGRVGDEERPNLWTF
jgi:hypothetical protein